MNQQRILVTGAAGFIGSQVAAHLAQRGHHVVGCDNFNTYYDPALKQARVRALLAPAGVSCATLDVCDVDALAELMAEHQVGTVLHLAAQAGVRHSVVDPLSYLQSNLMGFGQVLRACQRQGIAHLMYASSSSVYGARQDAPFRESDRCEQPESLYAATKLANELMAHSQARMHGLRCTGLRLFTVYGPWGRPDMAYFSFARRMREGQPITLYDGGKLWRDFTYIDDAVQAITRLLESAAPVFEAGQAPAEVFNVGHHQPVQVLDFVASLARALDCEPQLVHQPRPPGDVPMTCADSARLLARIGPWAHTPLDEGMRRFVDWLEVWEPMADQVPGQAPSA